MLEPGVGVEFGRYRMTGAPAYHGAGSVVEAVEVRTGEPRTLWLVMPHIVHEAAQRDEVVRVAKVLRRLESDHLVRLCEFGEVEGRPFFATESVAGSVDLARVADPDGIPPIEALELIAQVGTGIGHLHHAGVVDGALGPRRVLVSDRGGRVHATVRDAGILPVLIGTSALFGSHKQEALDFGAPELQHGGVPTTRADIYSLGCLLWLTLTGEPPFSSYVGHRTDEVPQVAGDGPVEEAVNAVLRTALAKDPEARYRDVSAFVGTLRAIAGLGRDGTAGPLPDRFVPLRRTPEVDSQPEVAGAEVGAEPAGADVAAGPASGAALGGPTAAPVQLPEAMAGETADDPADPAAMAEAAERRARVEQILAEARASLEPRTPDPATSVSEPHAPGSLTSAEDRSALAAVSAGWAPIGSLRPPEPAVDGPEPQGEPVEPAMKTALDHWDAGRSVSRLRRRRGKGGNRAARWLSVAAVLGGVALVTVWGVRHFQALDTAAEPSPTSSVAPDHTSTSGSSSGDPAQSLARLFPIVAKGDCAEDGSPAAHRLERWTCERNGYRVVLTHWDSPQHARDLVAHKGDGAEWRLQGKPAGTQWTWRAQDGSERSYRWTAVYADVPYAVIIEGRTADRRDYGRTHVTFAPSTALG